jgi:hypothetical protein
MSTVKIGGGSAIAEEVYSVIDGLLSPGETVLELGSGASTGRLCRRYKVYSVEAKMKYINFLNDGTKNLTMFHAPTLKEEEGWYDPEVIKTIHKDYSLILVDGPKGSQPRYGFLVHLALFRSDVPIIIDDVDRGPELDVMVHVAEELNRSYTIYNRDKDTHFGVVHAE